MIAYVLFSAAAGCFGGKRREPKVSGVVAASFQVTPHQILLLLVFGENDLVGDPIRHVPTLGR
jgi:hypothetical protein